MAGSKNSFFEVTFLISFLILALVYPVLAEKGEAKQPWFCHGIECPEYITKVRSGDKFEVRSYPQAKWVSTVVKVDTIKDFNDAQNDAFLRLYVHKVAGILNPSSGLNIFLAEMKQKQKLK